MSLTKYKIKLKQGDACKIKDLKTFLTLRRMADNGGSVTDDCCSKILEAILNKEDSVTLKYKSEE